MPMILSDGAMTTMGILMATVKKGTLTPAPQWWRHLRDWKRLFWKRERKAAQRDAAKRGAEPC